MKKIKILMTTLVTAVLALTATSCDKEVAIESTHTRVMQQEVYWDQWRDFVDGDVQYKYVAFDWDAITTDVLNYGSVDAFVYESDADGIHQCPLPYSYPIRYGDDFVPTNLRYILEPGKITFIREDLDGGEVAGMENTAPLTFRAVATVPVQYVID